MAVGLSSAIFASVKKWPDLEFIVRVRLKSPRMEPFDRHTRLSTGRPLLSIALSCTILSYLALNNNLEIEFRGHSRSLKLVPFESLGAVSYSPSIVTMDIYCIICEI